MDNKKTLILSIVGVLVLVIVVVGISYAMYTFSGTGEKVNVINTGSISVEYPTEISTISLVNVYPTTNAVGSVETDTNTLEFSVRADLSGTARIDYEVGIDPLTATLDDQYVKFSLQKKESLEASYAYVTGYDPSAENYAVTIDSIATNQGLLPNSTMTHRIDGGTFNSDGTHYYKLIAWVSDLYDLPTTDEATPEENEHSNVTTSATYSFKIKVFATQI